MREWLADAWWTVRDIWRDVVDAPLSYVYMACVIVFVVMMHVVAVEVGQNIREFGKDMHVIAEEIRNSE